MRLRAQIAKMPLPTTIHPEITLRGYFYSILIMLGMPATLAGSFGMYVWREMLKQRSVATEQNRSDSLPSA